MPKEMFETWGKRDPIALYEEYLSDLDDVTREDLEKIERKVTDEIDVAEELALESRANHMPEGPEALDGVYAT